MDGHPSDIWIFLKNLAAGYLLPHIVPVVNFVSPFKAVGMPRHGLTYSGSLDLVCEPCTHTPTGVQSTVSELLR